MHFITGGAFNGKSKWVKAYNQANAQNTHWFSAYKQNSVPEITNLTKPTLVLEGLEQWIKESLESVNGKFAQERWQSFLEQCLLWENELPERQVIIIGCDLSKGIVPSLAKEREWRDVTGRIYQDIVAKSKRMDVIWYGINQQIK